MKFIYFNRFNFRTTFFSSLNFLVFFLDIRYKFNSRANAYFLYNKIINLIINLILFARLFLIILLILK